MTHRLSNLLAPRSIALIGASDRSNWSNRIHSALDLIGFEGECYYINPKGGQAHGQDVVRSVGALDAVPDLAFVMVPAGAVISALRDAAEAGVKAAVVLSSGFAEADDSGREAQRELAELCAAHDMVVLGPNSLGYVNPRAKVALKPFQPGEALVEGSIAVVSQSGNVTVQLMNMARSFDVGLSLAVSTGNEMDVHLGDIVDFLAEEEGTRAIAVFAESFRDPQAFLAACRKARAAGKIVVCLKVGRSDAAARAALAHTGALVGNDAVIDAFLRSAGVVRVSALEDLLVVAETYSRTGPISGGLALLTISGGTCDIVADLAEEIGVEFPDLDASTLARLKELLPSYATAHNPLDITGAAVADATLFGRALEVVAADPGIGAVIAAQEIDFQAETSAWGQETFTGMARVANATEKPVLLANTTIRQITPRVREIRRDLRAATVFGGVDRILPALGAIQSWTMASAEEVVAAPPAIAVPAGRSGTWSEASCRPLLEAAGIPVVPGVCATNATAAAAAATSWGSPVALKIQSDDIVHKTDVGGVALGIAPNAVSEAADAMFARVREVCPEAAVDGILVSPMRAEGVDLLVGVVREAGWGNVLAVGLGGIWTEVMRDVQRVALPAAPDQIERALRSLRAWPLLAGTRGAVAVDLRALVDAIYRIANLSLALGEELSAIEVNPLRATAQGAEALDAAIVWSNAG